LATKATLDCQAGFCRLQARSSTRVLGLEGAEVPVTSPTSGQPFTADADVHFAWGGPEADASIVLVLDRAVLYSHEIAGSAVWGAVRTAVQERAASVAEGYVIRDGVWQPGPGVLPARQPLYFLAQLLVEPGKLGGASAPVPFIVGASWPEPGTACPVDGTCLNPARPQVCSSGTCHVVCASHLDCLPYGLTCGSFKTGVRVCE
jgi:hypothetical protein